MRKIVCFVFTLFLLLSCVSAYNGNVTVYVTRTGKCYHRDRCTYLHSRIEITLEDAVNQEYRPCSRCHPPLLGAGSEQDSLPYLRPSERPKEKKNGGDSGIIIIVLVFLVLGSAGSTSKPKTRCRSSKKQTNTHPLKQSHSVTTNAMPLSSQEPAILPEPTESALPPNPPKAAMPPPNSTKLPEPPAPPPVETDSDHYGKNLCMRETYRMLYEGKSLVELAGVPEGFWADDDGIYMTPSFKENWTIVFMSKYGTAYHRKGCPRAKDVRAFNICYALKVGRRPCRACKPVEQLPDWAVEYQRISQLCKQFNISVLP